MAQTVQPLKTIRIIAASARDPGVHRVVNIVVAKAAAQAQFLQTAGDQGRTFLTVKDSGGAIKGLPTIDVAGYTAPS